MAKCNGQESQHATIKHILQRFAETTTAHGFCQIVLAKHLLLKLFWILAVITCHVLIFIHAKPLVDHYSNKPVSTIETALYEYAPNYPVIVVCNENMIKRDKIDLLLQKMKNISGNNTEELIDYMLLADLEAKIRDDIFEFGYKFQEMFRKCTVFSIKDCTNEHYWEKFWHPRYGACFAFNDDHFQNGSAKKVEKAAHAGRLDSIELILNTNLDQYFKNLTSVAGIRLFYGEQGTLYQPQEKGLSLAPGFSYDISFSKRRYERIDPFNNGTCIKGKGPIIKRKGKTFTAKYDSDLCAKICHAKEIVKLCRCHKLFLPNLDDKIPLCKPDAALCLRKVDEHYVDGELKCLHFCRPPCSETMFLPDISFSRYLNLNNNVVQDIASAYARQDTIKVNIYFKSMTMRIIREKISYEFIDLVADIGGQLGLFSGYSVLTLIEFLFLFFTIIKFIVKRRSDKV